jgi:tRNA threonylcarbamoyladenosine biosynthesis protein TsaE
VKTEKAPSPGHRRTAAPPAEADVRTYTTRSETGTYRLARKIAKDFKGDEVVLLVGELGAGKTIFAKGLAAGLGIKDVRQVCSPTFTLVNIYQARVPIVHIDLYRLGGSAEIRDLGFEDEIGDGVILIEWGEKIDFPMKALLVEIIVGKGTERRISIYPRAPKACPDGSSES